MAKNKRLKPEYAEALLIYATTTEPLKVITDRLGLNYMNVGHYIRYNYPAVITQHKALLLSKERDGFAEGVRLLRESSLSPHQVRMQLGYSDKFIKFIKEHHPELQRARVFYNSAKNRPSKIAKYARAVELLAAEPKQPENLILYVAEKLGLAHHALRKYIYTHHPNLTQKRGKR